MRQGERSEIEASVERFLSENEVDGRASAALRAQAAEVQRVVLERGELSDCTNPSAALMSRIQVAKDGVASSARGGGARSSFPSRAGARVGGGVVPLGSTGIASLDVTSLSTPAALASPAPSAGAAAAKVNLAVEEFMEEEQIDERAAKQLREADEETQNDVISLGSLVGSRNPSAVVLARLRESKAALGAKEGHSHQHRHTLSTTPPDSSSAARAAGAAASAMKQVSSPAGVATPPAVAAGPGTHMAEGHVMMNPMMIGSQMMVPIMSPGMMNAGMMVCPQMLGPTMMINPTMMSPNMIMCPTMMNGMMVLNPYAGCASMGNPASSVATAAVVDDSGSSPAVTDSSMTGGTRGTTMIMPPGSLPGHMAGAAQPAQVQYQGACMPADAAQPQSGTYGPMTTPSAMPSVSPY